MPLSRTENRSRSNRGGMGLRVVQSRLGDRVWFKGLLVCLRG